MRQRQNAFVGRGGMDVVAPGRVASVLRMRVAVCSMRYVICGMGDRTRQGMYSVARMCESVG